MNTQFLYAYVMYTYIYTYMYTYFKWMYTYNIALDMYNLAFLARRRDTGFVKRNIDDSVAMGYFSLNISIRNIGLNVYVF